MDFWIILVMRTLCKVIYWITGLNVDFATAFKMLLFPAFAIYVLVVSLIRRRGNTISAERLGQRLGQGLGQFIGGNQQAAIAPPHPSEPELLQLPLRATNFDGRPSNLNPRTIILLPLGALGCFLLISHTGLNVDSAFRLSLVPALTICMVVVKLIRWRGKTIPVQVTEPGMSTLTPHSADLRAKTSPRISLIRERGKTITDQVRTILGISTLAPLSTDTRTKAGARIKELVDADPAKLTTFERELIIQYVRDGILGTANPDQRLDQFIGDNQQAAIAPPHQIEPELLQLPPRATIFDGRWGDLNPKMIIILALLPLGALACFLLISHISIQGIAQILFVSAFIIGVCAVAVRPDTSSRNLVQQGAAYPGTITAKSGEGDAFLNSRYKIVAGDNYWVQYEFERDTERFVGKMMVGRFQWEEAKTGQAITILWHPKYGSAIYKFCCYRAVESMDNHKLVSD
jgi:hypothetical protein